MKNITGIIILYLCLSATAFGQISEAGIPYSFDKIHLSKEIPVEIMPYINVAQLLKEDAINDKNKSIPWRFGYNIPVNLNTDNSGKWEDIGKGNKLWRLCVYAENAVSLNLTFNRFLLPEGARLFIYNKAKDDIVGAFTSNNNQYHGMLGTTIISGDKITIEYYEPRNAEFKGELSISTVTYGYRNLYKYAKGFGDAGSCNINVACSLGDDWKKQISSVAVIIVNGNEACTGALINNTCNDGTPYFLTANHCLGSNISTWVFRFNWESPDCLPSVNGPKNMTVAGASLKANSSKSDFALLQLNDAPPISYNVHYAGWDRTINIPDTQFVVHHPSGDVKKISFNYDSAYKTLWNGAEVWQITKWDTGTTEPGSSGSPLFNNKGQVIGQLYGGTAACNNFTDDNFGRFDVSWDYNNLASQRLKDWLDACNTGDSAIDAYTPSITNLKFDASIISISGIGSGIICLDSALIKVLLMNYGLDTLKKVSIVYEIDGTKDSVLWNGQLATNQSEEVSLPVITFSSGNHIFYAGTNMPNDSTDMNKVNDTKSINFNSINDGHKIIFVLKTDNWGSETSWVLKDSSGIILFSGGDYADVSGGQLIKDTLCLSNNSCYIFTIYDEYGDGLNGSATFGPDGYYYFLDSFNDTIGQMIQVNFGDSEQITICVKDSSNSINKLFSDNDVLLFPNPVNDLLFLKVNNQSELTTFSIYNLLGQELITSNFTGTNGLLKTNLSGLSKGVYILKIKILNKYHNYKIIKN
jgi:lysyl endopeptidase